MNMRSAAFKAFIGACAVVSAAAASAQSFTAPYPSDSSTVIASVGSLGSDSIGYFWSVARGDSVRESYSTGLSSVEKLHLEFAVTENVLDASSQVDWDVRVNGNTVGTWSHSAADGVGQIILDYTFTSIADGGGNYEVGMFVTNETAPGAGSIALSKNLRSSMTLTHDVVPEPASVATLAIGALAAIRRRRAR